MRWPWTKDRRLNNARREQAEIKRRGRRQEELAQRAEQHLRDDSFAYSFRRALGGRA